MITPSLTKRSGFTIVELLIVVVVIAILAAITIVAYNGIQNRTHDSAIQAELRSFGQKATAYYHENNNTFPAANAAGFGTLGLKATQSSHGAHFVSGGNNYNLLYCYDSTTGNVAFIAGSKSGKVYAYTSSGVAETSWGSGSLGTCNAHGININATGNHYWLYGHGGTNTWISWVR